MADTDVADANLEAVDNDGEGEGKKKFALSKKMLIIVAAGGLVVLLAGGGAAAYFLGWFDQRSAEEIALDQAQDVAPAYFFDLPEITVNLSNAEQRAQYLRMLVALEISDEEIITLIEPNLPRIMDVFQTYLRELRVSDLEGSAGLFRLKHELQRRINLAIFPAEVDAVLFREIIVQ